MNYTHLQKALGKLGFGSVQPLKRTLKLPGGWGGQSEELESRALLSAAARGGVADHSSAEVAKVHRKDPVVYPDVAGTWDLQVQGEFEGTGTVVMTQTDGGRTVTSLVTIPGFEQFTLVDKFKPKQRFELNSKSPRLDVPDFPLNVKLRVIINFPEGNLSPGTFTGSVRAPFVGEVATLSATKHA